MRTRRNSLAQQYSSAESWRYPFFCLDVCSSFHSRGMFLFYFFNWGGNCLMFEQDPSLITCAYCESFHKSGTYFETSVCRSVYEMDAILLLLYETGELCWQIQETVPSEKECFKARSYFNMPSEFSVVLAAMTTRSRQHSMILKDSSCFPLNQIKETSYSLYFLVSAKW